MTSRSHRARRPVLTVLLPLVALGGGVAGTTVSAAGAHASATTQVLADTSATTQVLALAAVDDAYTSSARPAYNDGTVARLVAGTLNGDTMVTYLKFTVATLPAGTTARKAELTLTRDEHHLPASVQLLRVADTAWSEKTLTYRTAPGLGAVIATAAPSSSSTGVTFDVSSIITTPGTYSFALTSPAVDDVARFRATEYGSDQPTLKVTVAAVPPPDCTVSDKLVPTCGILWGAAAGAFTSTPRDQALKNFEAASGRTASIYHTYHVGDDHFPTAAEIAMASDAANPRLLFTNWKVAAGTTWAKVAAGGEDTRIDVLASYIKTNYPGKFFMALHHEPENDVIPAAGSGMTATDYAAMFRHTVQRLRSDGVTNVVFVMAYMSYEKWFNQSWWGDLYPGNDVVDWIGVDAYLSSGPAAFHNGPFSDLMDRTTDAKFPGFYKWATANHPNKPLMLAEWGVYENTAGDLTVKPRHFDSVLPVLANYPALKALVAFDTPSTQAGGDLRIDSSPAALAALRKIAADPRFNVRIR